MCTFNSRRAFPSINTLLNDERWKRRVLCANYLFEKKDKELIRKLIIIPLFEQ
jgi:hypothetical protein